MVRGRNAGRFFAAFAQDKIEGDTGPDDRSAYDQQAYEDHEKVHPCQTIYFA
jgi:hypothetical protein